jgi:hypothetical protein
MAHLPNFWRKPEVIKCPPLPDGRATLSEPPALQAGGQQGKGSFQKWGGRRKHEAEPMYVANSEPTIWQRGGGRAGDELIGLIHEKLKAGIYRFKPGRRVLIPKEGSAKMRKLGIPVIMDRVVSQSTNLVFQEIFELDSSRSNYGFRRSHSQRQAIYHVQAMVKERAINGVCRLIWQGFSMKFPTTLF